MGKEMVQIFVWLLIKTLALFFICDLVGILINTIDTHVNYVVSI